MKLGITGTRAGLTVEQFKAMTAWMRAHPFAELHHGCCIGADDEADDAAKQIYSQSRSIAHPPLNRAFVSRDSLDMAEEIRDPLPYLDRNRAIVDACDHLLVLPKGDHEEQRSGTWSTYRYAMKVGRLATIVWPWGLVEERGKVCDAGQS